MHISSIWEQNIVKDVSLLNSLKVTKACFSFCTFLNLNPLTPLGHLLTTPSYFLKLLILICTLILLKCLIKMLSPHGASVHIIPVNISEDSGQNLCHVTMCRITLVW